MAPKNLRSKLWIPIIHKTLNRLPWMLLSCESFPRREFTVARTSQLWTQWKQGNDSLSRCHCHLSLIWHNKHEMPLWPSIHGQEGLIDAVVIAFVYFLLTPGHVSTLAPAPCGKMDLAQQVGMHISIDWLRLKSYPAVCDECMRGDIYSCQLQDMGCFTMWGWWESRVTKIWL